MVTDSYRRRFAAACGRRIMSGGRMGVTELLVGVPFPATAQEHGGCGRPRTTLTTVSAMDDAAPIALEPSAFEQVFVDVAHNLAATHPTATQRWRTG